MKKFGDLSERVRGIEPLQPRWQRGALPLCYTRERSERVQGCFALAKCSYTRNVLEMKTKFSDPAVRMK